MRIAFLGLGNMGGPMAANLHSAGHSVQGYDIAAAARERAAGCGIGIAETPAQACEEADAVVTMLPSGQNVEDAYTGKDGVCESAQEGALLIDSSTIDVTTARKVVSRAATSGLRMLDAPVSGGVSGAQRGTLTFMVGGEAPTFREAQPLFQAMGSNAVLAGPSGAGQAAKACNNMLLGISMVGLAEAFTLGKKLGLEAETLFSISSASSGCSWAMLNHLPVPGIVETSAANREFKPGFAASMMLKDLSLAQEAATATGTATPLGALVQSLYQEFVDSGGGTLDYAAIVRLIQERSASGS